jgi:hypothetical protein
MNRVLFALLVLALLFSVTAAAHDFVVRPGSPLAGQPFQLVLGDVCSSGTPLFTQNGYRLRVDLAGTEGACTERQPLVIDVPGLPAGGYELQVDLAKDDPRLRRAYVYVRKRGELPFQIHPHVIPAGTSGRRMSIRDTLPIAEFCRSCRVRVGGVEISLPYDQFADEYSFILPPLAPGFADVTLITNSGSEILFEDALYILDRSAPPDFAVFERVLFPVLFNAPGANGSLWRTESVIVQPREFPVEFYNALDPAVGTTIGAESRRELVGGNHRDGAVLLVPRREADALAFGSRVRDVSRVGDGFGTEIPVLRERDMIAGPLTLLDVPLDPQYRVKVRIYAYDDASSGTLIVDDAGNIREIAFTAVGDCADCAGAAYAEVDLPTSAPGARANLYVRLEGSPPSWAFATVTNNVTQQVTIVSVNRGDRP